MGIPAYDYDIEGQFAALAEMLSGRGIEVEEVKAKLKAQEIETPSWGYGNSGTRFGVFSNSPVLPATSTSGFPTRPRCIR